MTLTQPKFPSDLKLTGKLVVLKIPKPEDYPKLRDILNDIVTMDSLQAYFGRSHWSEEQVQERYQKFDEQYRAGLGIMFVVFSKNEQKIVGNCGLKNINLTKKSAEFGLILHQSVWGSGVAAECHLLCLDYAFHVIDLHRVYFTTDNHNHRMRGFFKKIGVMQGPPTPEGYLYYELHRDQWPDIKVRLLVQQQRRT